MIEVMIEAVMLSLYVWAWGTLAVMSTLVVKNVKEGKSPNNKISLSESLKWPADVIDAFVLVIKKMLEK